MRVITSGDLGGRTPGAPIASSHSAHVLLLAWEAEHWTTREREWWLANPDGTNLRRLPVERTEHVQGWSASGEIILLCGRTVEALDPEAGERRLIRELPGTEAGPDG